MGTRFADGGVDHFPWISRIDCPDSGWNPRFRTVLVENRNEEGTQRSARAKAIFIWILVRVTGVSERVNKTKLNQPSIPYNTSHCDQWPQAQEALRPRWIFSGQIVSRSNPLGWLIIQAPLEKVCGRIYRHHLQGLIYIHRAFQRPEAFDATCARNTTNANLWI